MIVRVVRVLHIYTLSFSSQVVIDQPAETYKGIHFGKLTSRRMDFSGKEGPGPGEYEPYQPEVKQCVATNLNIPDEDRRKFDAKLPRYHELVVKEEEKRVSLFHFENYVCL